MSSVNLPTSVDGGDGVEDNGGDIVVVQDLGDTYDLTGLADVTINIEALDINEEIDANTALTISVDDILRMTDTGSLTILANNGDEFILSGTESFDSGSFNASADSTFTITDGSQTAQVIWNFV